MEVDLQKKKKSLAREEQQVGTLKGEDEATLPNCMRHAYFEILFLGTAGVSTYKE